MYSVLRYLRKRCYEAANTGLAMDEINRTPKSYARVSEYLPT